MLRVIPMGIWSWMQYSALTFEFLAPLLLGVKALRPLGFLWGIGLHLMIALMLHLLIYFSLTMICYYVLFVDDRVLLRLWDRATTYAQRVGAFWATWRLRVSEASPRRTRH